MFRLKTKMFAREAKHCMEVRTGLNFTFRRRRRTRRKACIRNRYAVETHILKNHCMLGFRTFSIERSV